MPDSYTVIQERIQKALATIAPGTKPKVTRLAAEFNVPYDQLLNRYNGIPPKTATLTRSQIMKNRLFISIYNGSMDWEYLIVVRCLKEL
ncbi:hypothetical protein HO173_003775 [Letharia columbiana]|uniref:Uncharacterized protein n=1 Tax=Letharia columbiana TaxID=112416 RepID=A0A8H6G0H8_9LECA|nr:uncharacterized protein HO173_003775 [Letharia columbiana]KAF6238141.1 hypothetical protein HO173_003775 [Letharia columbiana]